MYTSICTIILNNVIFEKRFFLNNIGRFELNKTTYTAYMKQIFEKN
jgi:hypothetical protein